MVCGADVPVLTTIRTMDGIAMFLSREGESRMKGWQGMQRSWSVGVKRKSAKRSLGYDGFEGDC